MDLCKEYKFAYRIIKENPQLYQLFKDCIMRYKNLGFRHEYMLMRCIASTLYTVTPYNVLSIYDKLTLPKQVLPIIGKSLIVPACMLNADFIESIINLPTHDCKKESVKE